MKTSYRDSVRNFEKKQDTYGIREESEDKMDFYVAISPYYLSHVFKDRTGQTFIEYLSEKRIEQVKKLAVNGGIDDKEYRRTGGVSEYHLFLQSVQKSD